MLGPEARTPQPRHLGSILAAKVAVTKPHVLGASHKGRIIFIWRVEIRSQSQGVSRTSSEGARGKTHPHLTFTSGDCHGLHAPCPPSLPGTATVHMLLARLRFRGLLRSACSWPAFASGDCRSPCAPWLVAASLPALSRSRGLCPLYVQDSLFLQGPPLLYLGPL